MILHFSEEDILTSGVDEIIGEESLKSRLRSGKPLKVKLGIDPTSPNIHLGRSIPLWRLRAFQELGHEIHFIIGDFTGQVGDTSDKESERPMLSEETVAANLKFYFEQVWMIFNPDRKDQVHIHYNSEWLSEMTLGKLSYLADAFSVNTFVKRELIARRLEAGSRVSLREMLYPLMQGYDSIAVEADVEIGGTDQRFNLLAGRILQEQAGQEPQAIIMNTLINGADGRKMSSSWGNVISLLDTPADKFGKVMTILDELIPEYLLVLPISARPFTAEAYHTRFQAGENPRDLKLELAEAIVALYHGDEMGKECRSAFTSQFSEHQKPTDIPEVSLDTLRHIGPETGLVDILTETQLAPSKSEARRLIEQGGVRVDDMVISDTGYQLELRPMLIQVGKRRFVRLVN